MRSGRAPSGAFLPVFTIVSLIGLMSLALPVAALLGRAVDARPALDDAATRETLRDATILSITTSLVSLAIVVVVGIPVAWTLARRRFPGARVVDALIDLPIILPPAVAGIALLAAFGRRGVLGDSFDRLGISIGFSTTAVVIAQIFVSAPFFIRSARAGFVRVDAQVEEAAASLGAGPWRVFLRITLPLTQPSLIAGGILAWARSLGEFGATLMFAGNRQGTTQTMPLAIYERFSAGDLRAAVLLSALLLIGSVTFLLAIRALGDGRTGRSGSPI